MVQQLRRFDQRLAVAVLLVLILMLHGAVRHQDFLGDLYLGQRRGDIKGFMAVSQDRVGFLDDFHVFSGAAAHHIHTLGVLL